MQTCLESQFVHESACIVQLLGLVAGTRILVRLERYCALLRAAIDECDVEGVTCMCVRVYVLLILHSVLHNYHPVRTSVISIPSVRVQG